MDPAQQFDAGDGDRRGSEPLQAEHWSQPRFHAAMVLLDQVVQIFRRAHLRALGYLAVSHHLAHRSVGRCIAVQCDRPWGRSLALERLTKERLGRSDIAPAAQAEVHGFALAIHRSV
jgi:hypothetical protein